MRQCRTSVVPVALVTLGTLHSGVPRWLDMIPSRHNLQHFQKAVLLKSVVILRKILSSYIAMMVLASQKQGMLPVLAIDLTDKADLAEQDTCKFMHFHWKTFHLCLNCKSHGKELNNGWTFNIQSGHFYL